MAFEDLRKKTKELAGGKSSENCTFKERVAVYRKLLDGAETEKEKSERINAFRCGW